MYNLKTESGKGFRIEYPEFSGEGYGVANSFYRRMAEALAEYFGDLLKNDGRCLCRCQCFVEEGESDFTVRVIVTLRKAGENRNKGTMVHRWRKWVGRDAVLERE